MTNHVFLGPFHVVFEPFQTFSHAKALFTSKIGFLHSLILRALLLSAYFTMFVQVLSLMFR